MIFFSRLRFVISPLVANSIMIVFLAVQGGGSGFGRGSEAGNSALYEVDWTAEEQAMLEVRLAFLLVYSDSTVSLGFPLFRRSFDITCFSHLHLPGWGAAVPRGQVQLVAAVHKDCSNAGE